MNPFEDHLESSLRKSADGFGPDEHPISLNDVRGTARGIRRRRAAGSILAAAAVVTLAIGATTFVANERNGSEPPVATSPSPSPTEVVAPDGGHQTVLTTAVEGHGGEPGIPYSFDGSITLADGSQIPVQHDYRAFAPWGDGYAALRYDDQGNGTLDFLDANGKKLDQDAADSFPVVSADGSVLAYSRPNGAIVAVPWGQSAVVVVEPGKVQSPLLAGVTGSGACGSTSTDDCAVYYSAGEGGSFVALTSGEVSPLTGVAKVSDVSRDGFVSGVTSTDEDGSCSAVFAPSGEARWSTCDYTVTTFSDDGKYVIALPPYLDGIGSASIAILDAKTGHPVAVYTSPNDAATFVYDSQWDVDGTVLANVYGQGNYSLMRMATDGTLRNVSGGLAGGEDPTVSPLVLPTRA